MEWCVHGIECMEWMRQLCAAAVQLCTYEADSFLFENLIHFGEISRKGILNRLAEDVASVLICI